MEAVLLVVAKAQRDGRSWQAPALTAQLLLVGGTAWKVLAGRAPAKVPRGRANPLTKPGLQELWDKLEWVPHPDTEQEVAYLHEFLVLLGLPAKSLTKRSKAFNKILAKSTCEDRVEQAKLENKAGRAPWLASKRALRVLYKAL